jgi:glycosylphosphatidylinositol transamidase (GPIT) subunit GPI8
MKDLFDSYDRRLLHSTPGVRTDLFRRRLDEVKITDFFGNVQSVEIGGQGEVIDEDLLGQQKLITEPILAGNETVILVKKDALDVGSHGFEVKLQDGNVWVKGAAVMVCIILWMIAKRV